MNPSNQEQVTRYLEYCAQVLQLAPATIKRKRSHLRHFLEWAGETTFSQAAGIRPTFPVYLLDARNDKRGIPLSSETLEAGCEEARQFLTWSAREGFPIAGMWIDSIRPDRAHGKQSELKKREIFSLEEVRKIAGLTVDSLTDQRDQAAICFLFLSGMRADAFVTLSICCVDLKNNQVHQLPSRGVRTKNHKAAITHLLPIDDLWEVVLQWDQLVRSELPSDSLWYATLNTGRHLTARSLAGISRRDFLTKGIKRLSQRAGIDYHSPHKLRHGHAVYAIKHARDMKELKAVSQNLMHSSVTITDGVYGNMVSDDVAETIARLGKEQPPTPGLPDNIGPLLQALVKMQSNPDLLKLILES